MIVTIHQPEHIPWLGFFNKAINCDVFVLLDNVQYEKNYFQNRNNIINSSENKNQLITVPVKKGSKNDLINQKIISFDKKLKRRYMMKIENEYKKYPFYDVISQEIFKFYENENSLCNLNVNIIKYFFNYLGIACKTIKASDLISEDFPSGGIINHIICKKLKASTYLSGVSGKNYLDLNPFKQDKIKVIYQNFKHPTYKQKTERFISHLSILDLVFSFPPKYCYDLIKSGYSINQ